MWPFGRATNPPTIKVRRRLPSGVSPRDAFYYALTRFACAIYYRRELKKSIKKFVLIGVVSALGGLIMLVLFVTACQSYVKPDQDNTSIFGIGPPLIFGVSALALGLVLMVFARIGLPDFFKRKTEVVDPAHIAAEAAGS